MVPIEEDQAELTLSLGVILIFRGDIHLAYPRMDIRNLDIGNEMSISTVTLGELLFGAENSGNPLENLTVIVGYAARLEVLDYDREAAAQFAQLKVELANKLIGAYDLMIAAHARSRGLILVSNKPNEFKPVSGLRAENWLN